MQRMAHENTHNSVLGANISKVAKEFAAVLAMENHERPGGALKVVGDGETDALRAVVNGQNPPRAIG